jgi:hypothetical protein
VLVSRSTFHSNAESDLVRHLWQRWDYDSVGEMWSDYLTRFVYDGGVIAQEHLVAASEVEEAWVYTYLYLTYDYLRHTGGTRQRKGEVDKSYTDYFLLTDMGSVSGRFTRGASLSLDKAQREIAGDRQTRYSVAGGPPTTGDFTDVSNLGFASTYIESFGGTKEGGAQFFDALNQIGSRHYLPGLGRFLNRWDNNPYSGRGGGGSWAPDVEPPDLWPVPAPEPGDPVLPPGFDPAYPPAWSQDISPAFIGSGEPKLPGLADCCFSDPYDEYDRCMRQQYAKGWFAFCCANPCKDLKTGQGLIVPPCEPFCGCNPGPCGHDCTSTHCEWGFGFKGTCGLPQVIANLVNCQGREQAVGLAFLQACEAARSCACHTHNQQPSYWRYLLESETSGYRTYKQVWGCIAEICRTGNITFECGGKDCDGKFGYVFGAAFNPWARVHLCIEAHYVVNLKTGQKTTYYFSLANTILHEMLHKCGVSNNPFYRQTSEASEEVANGCIGEAGTNKDQPLLPPPPFPQP